MFISLRSRFVAAALVVLSGRLSVAQTPTSARSAHALPGCYRLTLGPWSKVSNLGPDKPTSIIRLDTSARYPGIRGDLVAERIEPAEFAPPGDPRLLWQEPARWRRMGKDSVVIVAWSTGTEAEVFYGRWSRDWLRGVMRRTSDAIPIDPKTKRVQWDAWPWASASGASIPCPG